jgi:hypothetical protein
MLPATMAMIFPVITNACAKVGALFTVVVELPTVKTWMAMTKLRDVIPFSTATTAFAHHSTSFTSVAVVAANTWLGQCLAYCACQCLVASMALTSIKNLLQKWTRAFSFQKLWGDGDVTVEHSCL